MVFAVIHGLSTAHVVCRPEAHAFPWDMRAPSNGAMFRVRDSYVLVWCKHRAVDRKLPGDLSSTVPSNAVPANGKEHGKQIVFLRTERKAASVLSDPNWAAQNR